MITNYLQGAYWEVGEYLLKIWSLLTYQLLLVSELFFFMKHMLRHFDFFLYETHAQTFWFFSLWNACSDILMFFFMKQMHVQTFCLVNVSDQTWEKCVIVLDSNVFLCSIDLVWCKPRGPEGGVCPFQEHFVGSNTLNDILKGLHIWYACQLQ